MNITVTGKPMDLTSPEYEAFINAGRIVPSEQRARELALQEREAAVARAEAQQGTGVAATVPISVAESVRLPQQTVTVGLVGVWLAYVDPPGDFRIFGTEIEALRYAVANSMTVKFLEFGADPHA